VRQLREDRPVSFRALGSSMSPRIRSFQRVEVRPANPELLDVGDVVVADVASRTFLHAVSAIDHTDPAPTARMR
jgi:hypothetical protein